MRIAIEALPTVTFEARVADERWNGWLCPSFSKVEAQRLMEKWNAAAVEGGFRHAARYDEKRDAFGFYCVEAEILDPDSRPDDWEWFERCDGTYAIGAWGWCWAEDAECERTNDGHKYEGALTDSETVDGHNWRCSTCGLVVGSPVDPHYAFAED